MQVPLHLREPLHSYPCRPQWQPFAQKGHPIPLAANRCRSAMPDLMTVLLHKGVLAAIHAVSGIVLVLRRDVPVRCSKLP